MDTYDEEKPRLRFETIILEKGVFRLYVSLFRFYVEQTRDETPWGGKKTKKAREKE